MRGLEPRLSKYLTVIYLKNQNRLIKHQFFTSDVDVESFNAGRVLHHPYPRAFCTLPSFARIKGSTSTYTESHGKIGDCEQSINPSARRIHTFACPLIQEVPNTTNHADLK